MKIIPGILPDLEAQAKAEFYAAVNGFHCFLLSVGRQLELRARQEEGRRSKRPTVVFAVPSVHVAEIGRHMAHIRHLHRMIGGTSKKLKDKQPLPVVVHDAVRATTSISTAASSRVVTQEHLLNEFDNWRDRCQRRVAYDSHLKEKVRHGGTLDKSARNELLNESEREALLATIGYAKAAMDLFRRIGSALWTLQRRKGIQWRAAVTLRDGSATNKFVNTSGLILVGDGVVLLAPVLGMPLGSDAHTLDPETRLERPRQRRIDAWTEPDFVHGQEEYFAHAPGGRPRPQAIAWERRQRKATEREAQRVGQVETAE